MTDANPPVTEPVATPPAVAVPEPVSLDPAPVQEPEPEDLGCISDEIPVIIIRNGMSDIPDDVEFAYAIASNGVYIIKNGTVTSCTKVPDGTIPLLEPIETYADLDVSMIPVEMTAMILNFFRAIYNKMHTEVNVLLYFNPNTFTWRVHCPEQTVTAATVRYDNDNDRVFGPEWHKLGTIHSHCEMGGFHSGTDHGDEGSLDGLHVVIGRVTSDYPDMSLVVAVNGTRFKKDADEYFAGAQMGEHMVEETRRVRVYKPPPRRTHRAARRGHSRGRAVQGPLSIFQEVVNFFVPGAYVQSTAPAAAPPPVKAPTPVAPATASAPKKEEPEYRTEVTKRKVTGLSLALPEGKTIDDFPFPEEWLERVKRPAARTTTTTSTTRHGGINHTRHGIPTASTPGTAWGTTVVDHRDIPSGGQTPIGFGRTSADEDTCYQCLLPHELCICDPDDPLVESAGGVLVPASVAATQRAGGDDDDDLETPQGEHPGFLPMIPLTEAQARGDELAIPAVADDAAPPPLSSPPPPTSSEE